MLSRRKLKILLIITLVFLSNRWSAPVTQAATTPPPYTYSYYMWTTDSQTLYNLGYNLGQQDLNTAGTQDHFLILNFGKPKSQSGYGTLLYDGGGFASTSQIASAVEQFARGYYLGTGTDTSSTTFIAIGTTNYYDPSSINEVTPSHGQAWGQMVDQVASWVVNGGYSRQVTIVGASDMELDWNSRTTTRNWVDAYSQAGSWALYDYGDAGGCPSSSSTNTKVSQPCNNGWTQDDVFYISNGAPKALPSPQIYNTQGTNANQWRQVALYGYNGPPQRFMYFYVELTQYKACQQRPSSLCNGANNTPATGWTQLSNALNGAGLTQSIRWSTDIRYK